MRAIIWAWRSTSAKIASLDLVHDAFVALGVAAWWRCKNAMPECLATTTRPAARLPYAPLRQLTLHIWLLRRGTSLHLLDMITASFAATNGWRGNAARAKSLRWHPGVATTPRGPDIKRAVLTNIAGLKVTDAHLGEIASARLAIADRMRLYGPNSLVVTAVAACTARSSPRTPLSHDTINCPSAMSTVLGLLDVALAGLALSAGNALDHTCPNSLVNQPSASSPLLPRTEDAVMLTLTAASIWACL